MNCVISKYILVLIFAFAGTVVIAQRIDRTYQTAERLFYEERLVEALEGYSMVIEMDSDYQDADYKAEICRLLTIDRDKELGTIEAFAETKGKRDKFYHYWLGRIYASRYKFIEAIASWKRFLDSQAMKSREIIAETKKFIEDAKRKIAFFENTDQYEIHQLPSPINTEKAELSPAYFVRKDELLFASDRDGDKFKIYHAIRNNEDWQDIREISILGEFTRENANIEVVDEDGRLFIFRHDKGGDLFFSQTRNDNWLLPVEFDSKVTSAHIKSHFYINEHEDRIIFASDKNSKTHGLDLYQTFRDVSTGKWSKPAPFGLSINSDRLMHLEIHLFQSVTSKKVKLSSSKCY
jgi:hypothetical protein